MSRLNMLKVIKALHFPEETHSSLYRLLFTLESPGSKYYNPHAAQILYSLFLELSRNGTNGSDERNRLYVLFLGVYESLMVSLCSFPSSESVYKVGMNEMARYLGFTDKGEISVITLVSPISKFDLGEKVAALLYARKEKRVTTIENYCPRVELGSLGAELMVNAMVKIYIASTPESEKREKKLIFLKKRVKDLTNDEDERWICEMIVNGLENHSDLVNSGGGDIFNRLLREAIGNKNNESTIRKCVNARNKAVHEGNAEADNEVLGQLLYLLVKTPPALSSEEVYSFENEQIDRKVTIEVSKDLRYRRVSRIIGKIMVGIIMCVIVWIGSIIVASIFAGKTDMDKLRWESVDQQLDVRINEAIATKDTAQLLKIQHDLKWIKENLK